MPFRVGKIAGREVALVCQSDRPKLQPRLYSQDVESGQWGSTHKSNQSGLTTLSREGLEDRPNCLEESDGSGTKTIVAGTHENKKDTPLQALRR